MKNRKIFDLGLYREAILQLRPFGVISVILLLGNALVNIAAEAINYFDEKEYVMSAAKSAGVDVAEVVVEYTATLEYYQYQFMAFAFMLVMVPIMTLYLFSFLNRRNMSDFYHSIPHTRLCLSLSFLFAIVTYIVLIVGVCGAVGAAGFYALPCEVEVYEVGIAVPIFNVICGSIFMMSVFWLAMSLTGTIFMNIAAAALIFAIPTCVLFYTGYVIREFVPYIPYEGLPGIFNGSCNVITGMFSYMVFWSGSSDYDVIFGSASTGAWTFVTALVLVILGLVFFRFRKSEYAESASIHPMVQSIFRIGAGFLLSMFVTGSILMFYQEEEVADLDYIFWWVVFYVIAIFAYYLFELVTTRQPRRLLHIWKGLLVVVLANVIWAGGEYAICMAEMNWCPDAEDIVSVELADTGNYYSSDWWQTKIDGVTLNSDEMLSLVAETMANTIDLWQQYRADPDRYWTYYEEMISADDWDETDYVDKYYYNMAASVTFTIHTKTGTTVRTVKMTKDQYSRFISYLAGEEEGFAANYVEMPDFSKVESMECSFIYNTYGSYGSAYEDIEDTADQLLTAGQWKEIYDTYCAEMKTANFASFFYLTYEENGYWDEYLWIWLEESEGRSYYVILPLTTDFPQTLSLIATYTAQAYEEFVEKGAVSDENILREVTNSDSCLTLSYMCLMESDETELSGYEMTYSWQMITDLLWYYAGEYYSAVTGSEDLSGNSVDGGEATATDAEAETSDEAETESGDYTYQDYLALWNKLADELDNCRNLEITQDTPVLFICANIEYYGGDSYDYYSFGYVTAVTDTFVELFEEYNQMTGDAL